MIEKITDAFANIHRVVKTDEDLEWNRAVWRCTEIVQEVAKEYGTVSDNDLAVVSALPSLYPLQSFEEEAIHKVVASAKDGGWIPVETALPKESVYDGYVEPSESVLVFTKYNECRVSRYWGNRRNKRDYYDWVDIKYRTDEVIAWMPLPLAPYQKGVL